ncbi:3-oxoacyl-ACP reductase FabG [Fodinicola feengrottensis]|uniref:3-oxoacyl-ACP reductase FabG n=1 Tax=Fodinicola feengrottensis TaxID=435914 RepID=A0ABP4TWL6_9ACTN
MSLAGKVALVTGGSRGIGAATARRLASEGAAVAITYERAEDRAKQVVAEILAAGGRAVAIRADAANAADVTASVERTVSELGRLDILVNNAGIFVAGPLADVTVEQIDRTFAIHVRAVFVAVQAAAKHLPAGGRVVSIGSNLADIANRPGVSLYAASKAALAGLTKGLARDLGEQGVTVNLVQPGSTDTEMNPADGEHADQQRQRTALGHYGTADDIAATVAHLVGDGGRQITGATITVDGGANA